MKFYQNNSAVAFPDTALPGTRERTIRAADHPHRFVLAGGPRRHRAPARNSMSATLKQAVVIENVVGAGGTIGTNGSPRPSRWLTLLLRCRPGVAPRSMQSYRSTRSAISRRSARHRRADDPCGAAGTFPPRT